MHFLLGALLLTLDALAQPTRAGLAERLGEIRGEVMEVQKGLIEGLRAQKETQSNLGKIQTLIRLQSQERDLSHRRLKELENTIGELQLRRGQLRERVRARQKQVRLSLADIERSMRAHAQDKIEAPRRKVLAKLVDRDLRELEELRADLADADQLELRIQEEQSQLAYLFQDLSEKESILELNRQLQLDLLKRRHVDRLAQLESYRRLKASEQQVEQLISDFNARIELEKALESEREASRGPGQSAFAKLKGRLGLPVSGRVVAQFGRHFDAKSNLTIFKKGVDIAAGAKEPVKAVAAGKVAYAGELPNYGRVAIVDHGGHYYSLCANLGSVGKKVGDEIAEGDVLGFADDTGTPVYFEIRARNIAVNPLQWVSNETTL